MTNTSVCVFASMSAKLQSFTDFFLRVTRHRGSVFLWRRGDTFSICGFVDDVVNLHIMRHTEACRYSE